MVTERVAIWDFFNVKDCDFCLKLCILYIHIKNEYSEKTGTILKYSHNKESFEMNDRRI